jgi:putative ABC transport system substrate-binding protein
MSVSELTARALLLLAVLAGGAHAGGVVAISDWHVAQYSEALVAAREVVRNLPVIDQNAGDAVEQLKKAEPAAVLAVGQRAVQLAKEALPQTPIVFCVAYGPQVIASRSVTGVKLEVAPTAQLERLRQVAPSVKRLGLIYDPRTSGAFVEEALKAAGRVGLTLVVKPVNDAKRVPEALSEVAEGIDALWLMADPRLVNPELIQYILVFTLERKIALFGFLDSITRAGALASVAVDYQESGRVAARMAAEIAARGLEARLPVPPPISSPGSLTVNTKTARQIGLDIAPEVLARARQVYR